MLLFHKLDESDQHNSIHYCLHLVIEDMLDDEIDFENFADDDDKDMQALLEKVVAEAKELPDEQQFEFIAHHPEVGQIVFDIALDMARSAYYPSDDELVINFESLRCDEPEPEATALLETLTEVNAMPKKDNSSLN